MTEENFDLEIAFQRDVGEALIKMAIASRENDVAVDGKAIMTILCSQVCQCAISCHGDSEMAQQAIKEVMADTWNHNVKAYRELFNERT